MDRDHNKSHIFTRRALIIGGLQGALMTALGARLAWLQIAQGQRYKTLADNNRINIKMIAPPRGYIVDRFDRPLAINGQNFRVLIIPEQTQDLATALSSLQKLIPLTQRDIQRIVKQAERSLPFAPLEVKDHLVWEEVSRIEVNLPELPGVFIDEGEVRYYSQAESAAHLVGYVGAANKGDVSSDPLLRLPGFKIGKSGIEKTFDKSLRGTAGAAEVEVNVVGREVRELRKNPGKSGEHVKLSIDMDLQNRIQARLASVESASAVLMDVKTGAVYALASYPSFDSNMFSRGIPFDKWEELQSNPKLPLTNKAVAGQYPPGSTFKLVTALAALEKGVVDNNTTVFCPGHYEYGNARFHCWKKEGHGTVNINKAMAESCDTYFYKLSTELGVDNIAEYAQKLGLGQKLGFELGEERPGLVPTKAWKRARFGETWHPGESIVTSIGQGFNLATPLQLAVMTARVVNGGFAVKPWVAAYVGGKSQAKEQGVSLGFNPKHLKSVIDGMVDCVNSPRGTAYGARIKDKPEFAMGGKSGTAQVKRITREERAAGIKNESLPWIYRHHALFVGYAPLDNPRYACAVVVEHGGGGSGVAAPIVRDILQWAQELNLADSKISPEVDVSVTSDPALRKEDLPLEKAKER